MKTSIALIGFMGTGKSVVGKTLAQKLALNFVDLDAVIEQTAGKSITQIFQQDGEIAFRDLEIAAVKAICANKYQVIACGGGVVLNTINIDRLKREAVVVLLETPEDIILRRTNRDTSERPLLKGDEHKIDRVRELLRIRQPFYKIAADITLDTSNLDIEAVAELIVHKLKENEGFSFQK